MKLLIIDDEPEVRDLLEILLRSYNGVEVIGQAASVDEAITLTVEHAPDLVLLDIQMPEKDGFQYLDELHYLNLYPGIIFVTAYENYAIRAIRNAAFDYLLKPIKKEELFEAINRYMEKSRREQHNDINQLIALLHKTKPGKIKLNTRTGYSFVDPDEIILIEADGNYSELIMTSGKKELSTLSLGSIERELEFGTFLRVSRSFLVNMRYVTRVDRKSNICELENQGEVHRVKIPQQKIKLLEEYFAS